MATHKPLVIVNGGLQELPAGGMVASSPSLAIAEGATTPNPGIVGVSCWSTTLLKPVYWTGSAWTAGSASLTPTEYLLAASKVNGLFRNGSCQDGANTNYSGLVFDNVLAPAATKGFFKHISDGSWPAVITDDYLPVATGDVYQLVADVKQIVKGSTSNAVFYAGLMQFDMDNNIINAPTVSFFTGTKTTLAANLVPGATTITLTSSSGWQGNNAQTYNRAVSFYNYVSASGFIYDHNVNPYTRWTRDSLWAVGGITGNVITLSSPWNFPNPQRGDGVWLAGTVVSNASSGGSYNYRLAAAINPPSTYWQRLNAYIGGGVDVTGQQRTDLFRPGTQKVKFFTLPNYGGMAGDVQGIANIGVYRTNFAAVPP